MKSLPEYDLIIVGGGLVGASLAGILLKENIRIAIIEAITPEFEQQPSYDDRGLALSLSSIRMLNCLGIRDEISADTNPIRQIHVSDQKHFGFVRMHADNINASELGCVVLARTLGKSLLKLLGNSGQIDMICPARVKTITIGPDHAEASVLIDDKIKTLTGKLVVAADGSHSTIREMMGVKTQVKDYGQTAIVTNVTPEFPHHDTAYERFTPAGPLAMLPLTEQRCAVVFTVKSVDSDYYMEMDDHSFLQELNNGFGARLGKLDQPGKRKSYPVKQILVSEQVKDRLVILGNAAHTIHPNAAQGFNLCLRDVAGLAELLISASKNNQDIGKKSLLLQYLIARQDDQNVVTDFTDTLASLFYNQSAYKIITRNLGMHFLDKLPVIKRALLMRMTGLHGKQPLMISTL